MHLSGKYTLCTVLLCLLVCDIGGCDRIGRFAKERSEKAGYQIIGEKQRAALGQAGDFSIDPATDEITRQLLERTARLDWSSDSATTPTTTITLSDALELAVANSRDYKSQREALFTQALALTEARRNYGPIYTATAFDHLTRAETGHGTPAGGQVENFGTRGISAGVTRLLATGATVGLSFSHQFVRYLSGDPRPVAADTLGFNVVQPLLAGAGSLATMEPLVDAERGMIYAVRAFRRYQQGFIIDVAARYYDLLATQDQLHNASRNYESAETNWRKLQRYNDGGLTTRIEVDQARQKVLEAEAGLASTQKGYSRQLDQFKLFLGLPFDLDLGPDHQELEAVAARGLLQPDMTLRQAVDRALEERLDLRNTFDSVTDADRQLKITEQNFLPGLNAFYQFSTAGGADKDRLRLNFSNNTQQYGLDLTLPLDWTVRRNTYRRALLARDQAQRSYDQARDSLILEVRDAWRELEELRTNYRIQQESVRLAERQVQSTSMMLQMSRATARDLLEAQDNLLASRNAATAALVSHTIQRLRFWNAIERLEIDPKGMWYEKPAGK